MELLELARRSLAEFRTPPTTLLTPSSPVRAAPDAPTAVVIGAGFGGLAAAVRLLVRGYRVVVLDRLEQAGGRARVFSDDGFTFDAGPTIVTAPFLFEELWALAGERMSDHVTLVPTTPFYRIRFGDGQHFDYTGDREAMRREIARFNPRDVEGWERLLSHAEKIFDVGFTALAHAPFGKASDMARVAPDMVRLENYRTVYSLVSKYIEDERLRQVFSFHPLLIGGNPMAASSIYTLIAHLERKWGVHFAMGGTGALVSGLVSLIERLGGQVRLGAEVEQILVEGGRARGVRLKGRERIEADLVVSNADSAWTYRHLVSPEHRTHWTDRRLDRARYSMGLFVWYFGTKTQYPDVAHHTIMLGPRYQGLLHDIFENKVLSDDFSLYLHRPTATDPSLAPKGCDAFYVLSPVPHLQSGTDWKREREGYRLRLQQFLERTVLPGLEGSLVTSRVLDPQGFLDDYLSMYGAAFGLEPVLTQSAYFRPHNESEEVRGLYLVGAGTHPGAGLPGVLSTARVLDTVVPDPARLAQHLGR